MKIREELWENLKLNEWAKQIPRPRFGQRQGKQRGILILFFYLVYFFIFFIFLSAEIIYNIYTCIVLKMSCMDSESWGTFES